MYIRRLKICNFKSYRNETLLFDLSPGLNTFFGRNGAGKSNLFDAIRFVLIGNQKWDKNSINRNRLRLLSDGCKGIVSVELDLVTEHGVFTLKKEMDNFGFKYYVDGAKIRLKHFTTLLNNFGFPDSPEFYFVDRKLFNNVILASNEERLKFFISNLGKAISKQLRDHKNLMTETEKHFMRFNSFQEYLEFTQGLQENLKDAEFAKWKNYEKLQKRKEYLFLLTRYKALVANKNKFIGPPPSNDDIKYEKNAKKMSYTLKEKKEKIQVLESFLNEQKKEMLELLRKKHKVELELQDLLKIENMVPHLTKIDTKSVKEVEGRLLTFKAKKEDKTSVLEKLKNEVKHNECERDVIIEKLGVESGELSNPDWLAHKIKTTVDKIQIERAASIKLKQDIQMAKQSLSQYRNKMENAKSLQQSKVAAKSEKNRCDIQYRNLQVELNKLQRMEFSLQSELMNLESQFNGQKGNFVKRAGKNTMNAVLSVRKVIASWKESNYELADGYYGMVIDNIDCDPNFNIVIDVTIRNLLFSHIIKNNEIGLEILKEMKLNDLPGEVSFIPLNRIKPKEEKRIENPNAHALLRLLRFPDNVEKAIRFCFTNIFVCRNIDVAVDFARSYQCTTVTLDGEVISGSGVMNGGYRKKTDSLIDLYKKFQSSENKMCTTNLTLADCKGQIVQLSDQINQTLSEIQKLESFKYNIHSEEIKRAENDMKRTTEAIVNLEGMLNEKELEVSIFLNQLNILQSQAQHEFNAERLIFLNKRIIDLKKEICKQQISVLECEKKEEDYEKLYRLLNIEIKEAMDKKEEISLIKLKISNLNDRKELLKRVLDIVSERIKSTNSDLKREIESENELSKLLTSTEEKSKKMHYSKEALTIKTNALMRNEIEKEIKNIESLLKMKSIKNKSWFNDKNLTQTEINREMIEIKNKITSLGKVVNKTDVLKRIAEIKKIATIHRIAFEETCITSNIFTECNNWLENHISEMISKLSDLTDSNYKVFFPNQGVHLSLETDGEELHTIHGLNMDIVTSGGSQLLPEALSGSQKTALVISTVLAFVKLLDFGICVFDEIDQFLSEQNIKLFRTMFSAEMKDIQFFAASHKEQFIRESDASFFINNFGNKSFVEQIDKEKTDPMALLQAATKASSCSPEDDTYSF